MNHEEKAQDLFSKGFSCSQAVLTSFCDKYEISENVAKKISSGFGAGCGRMSLTCGAVTGAFMVIGLKFGKIEADDEQAKDTTYRMINEFCEKFKEKYGSVNCYELLGCDLATEGGRTFYNENDLHNKECTCYVKSACSFLTQMGL